MPTWNSSSCMSVTTISVRQIATAEHLSRVDLEEEAHVRRLMVLYRRVGRKDQVHKAMAQLRARLRPLGYEPDEETTELYRWLMEEDDSNEDQDSA